MSIDPKVPLAVYEARNALRIAQAEGAEKYAPDAWAKASQTAAQMEDYLARKQKNPIITAARDASQQAEDARSIAVKKAAEEKVAAEKQAAADKLAEQQQQAAQREAELKAQQEAAAARAARSPKPGHRRKRHRRKLRTKPRSQRRRQPRLSKQQQELRAQLLAQLNSVLQTVDTPRGWWSRWRMFYSLRANFDLSQDAGLKLARLSGVILAHPGLKLRIEGYTDSTGGQAFNLTLSGQRADAVRAFLVQQGLSPEDVTSTGLGQTNPVADNSTTAGRQQNRRVEIIVSGEAIGAKIG